MEQILRNTGKYARFGMEVQMERPDVSQSSNSRNDRQSTMNETCGQIKIKSKVLNGYGCTARKTVSIRNIQKGHLTLSFPIVC